MTLRDLLTPSTDTNTRAIVVLDGAMSTELEKLGTDTANALWGALALEQDPEAVTAVHRSYFAAGAHVATTNTYQATVAGFVDAGLGETQARELIAAGGRLALAAAQDTETRHRENALPIDGAGSVSADRTVRPALAAGSIGPYGAYLADGSEYTGAYSLTRGEFEEFHRPRIEALTHAGIRNFAVETQPRLDEVQAVVELLAREFSATQAWVSFQVRDSRTLADGTDLADAARWVDAQPNVVAVGVNCVPPERVTGALEVLCQNTSLPLCCYPNSGDYYDPASKTWTEAAPAERFTEYVTQWVHAGARMIGGCCRTSPDDIALVASRVV